MQKLVCLLLLFPLFAWAKPVLNIQHWKTDNGAKVYFVRAPEIPMVDVQVVFAAGSARDGQQWGKASIANGMLNEGTRQHSADQIAQAFDSVGAQFGNDIDRDMAIVSLRSLVDNKYLQPALQTFTEVLTEANFPEKAFQRVKQQALTNLKYQQQSPGVVAVNAFYQAVYRNHPYGHSPNGTEATVKALTVNNVKAFYQQYYVASNANVILVGDISRAQAQKIAEQVVRALPRGQVAAKLPLAISSQQSTYQFIPFPAKQNTIIFGQVGIKRNNPDYFPFIVGNRVFGGLPLTSILFEQVRNKRGLAYAVYSALNLLQYKGPFYVSLQTRTDKAAQALKIAQESLQQFIKAGPTKDELQSAQKNIIGSFPLQLSTNASIDANVVRIAFYQLPLDFLDTYRRKISAVNTSQVKAAFQHIVHPAQMKTVVVGAKKP